MLIVSGFAAAHSLEMTFVSFQHFLLRVGESGA